MKRILRPIAILLALSLCICALVGCGEAIDTSVAQDTIYRFIDALSSENYTLASEYLHPHFSTPPSDIVSETYVQLGIDLTDGVTEREITGYSSSVYTSEVDGSRLELTVDCLIGGREAEIVATVADNVEGYGIYYFNIYVTVD